MSVNQEPVVSSDPSPVNHLDPAHIRRVSIVDNGLHGHDNLSFESHSRKTSANSDHVQIGPVRKKSILHHSAQSAAENASIGGLSDSGKHVNGDARRKKNSVTDSVHSKTRFSDVDEEIDLDRSWWYTFCLKCRPTETHPSWQPTHWSKVCPYPFCPTYRQFSRIIALGLIGILLWCVVYAIIGETAAPPDGKLFQLIILSISSYFGGWIFGLTTLPALIGMFLTGLVLQNVNIVDIDDEFSEICKELRNVALVIILIRAGLDLDPIALRRLKYTVIRLGLVPWFIEAAIATLLSHYLLDLQWDYAILLGPIVAAVSPAVVVPCLFRLRSKGYGVAKGIPTLIIAVAGVDDATSVAIFGIIKSIMFSKASVTELVLQGPISVVGGIGFGVLWGMISKYVPEKHDPFVVPLRVILLLVGGMVSVFGSDAIGYGGAGPLACVAAAFVSLVCWNQQGWEIEENPAVTAFEIFWMIFEPILFGVTGASIKLRELDGRIASIGLGILITGVVLRILTTIIIGIGCKLNMKEKLFVAFAWMSKATVQAALAPIALGMIHDKDSEEYADAEKILMVSIISIMLTAPLGGILITILGPRLLTKTKIPVVPEGWRRSHRPSIRDISIIDEDEEDRDSPDVEASDEIVKDMKTSGDTEH